LDKKLATAIDAMDCRRGKEFHDVFDEFLDLSLECFNESKTKGDKQ
jgi:hypothetical protein